MKFQTPATSRKGHINVNKCLSLKINLEAPMRAIQTFLSTYYGPGLMR